MATMAAVVAVTIAVAVAAVTAVTAVTAAGAAAAAAAAVGPQAAAGGATATQRPDLVSPVAGFGRCVAPQTAESQNSPCNMAC